jgi:two-component system, OmpR family, sensor kinase
MSRGRILLVFVPLVIGILASILAQAFFNPVPLLVFKIDLGMVIFIAGLLVSLFLGAAALQSLSDENRIQTTLDQTRRQEAERRRRFIRRLDHEMKNPLMAAQAALVNVQEAAAPDEQQRAKDNAQRSVERLSRLLADLRKLSDLGERPIEQLPIDIPELLEEMVNAARSLPRYKTRDIRLVIARVPALPRVTGDRDLLGLAVYNLIDNALKFTGESDALEVRAREDGKSIVIEVADSGAGIPSEELSSIFEELYRGANARGVEGSGLGLPLVRRIIALHGGDVSVRSQQNGAHGTTFMLHLPAAS